MSTGSITSALSGLLGDSRLGVGALSQPTAKIVAPDTAVAAQTAVYAANPASLLLSNATYTNFGIMQGTTAQSGATGRSRYVDATLGARVLQREMDRVQQNSIMRDLNQYGGVNVSGTNYPNALAPSENEVKANLKRKGSAVMMKQAAEDAKKEQVAAEKDAQETASAGTQAETAGTTATTGDAGTAQGGVTAAGPVATQTDQVVPAEAPAVAAGGDTPTGGLSQEAEGPGLGDTLTGVTAGTGETVGQIEAGARSGVLENRPVGVPTISEVAPTLSPAAPGVERIDVMV